MVKTVDQLDGIVMRYVEALSRKIDVERILVSGEYASGRAAEHSDIQLLVVSPTFEEMEWGERSDILALTAWGVDPLIQAWGFTPVELRDSRTGGTHYDMFLSMMLFESREIYTSPAVKETQEDCDD